METAKLFINGRSQAVRLPKKYQFKGDDVYIREVDGIVMLIPKDDPWGYFRNSLDKFSSDFMAEDRDQGRFEEREEI